LISKNGSLQSAQKMIIIEVFSVCSVVKPFKWQEELYV